MQEIIHRATSTMKKSWEHCVTVSSLEDIIGSPNPLTPKRNAILG